MWSVQEWKRLSNFDERKRTNSLCGSTSMKCKRTATLSRWRTRVQGTHTFMSNFTVLDEQLCICLPYNTNKLFDQSQWWGIKMYCHVRQDSQGHVFKQTHCTYVTTHIIRLVACCTYLWYCQGCLVSSSNVQLTCFVSCDTISWKRKGNSVYVESVSAYLIRRHIIVLCK